MVPFNTRLLPAPVNGGYHETDHWIWCGSVVRGDDRRRLRGRKWKLEAILRADRPSGEGVRSLSLIAVAQRHLGPQGVE
jgi:hypothetical protein